MRTIQQIREHKRLYARRPEVMAKSAIYRARPEVIARAKLLRKQPKIVARIKASAKKYRSRPENKARMKAYQIARNRLPEIKMAKLAHQRTPQAIRQRSIKRAQAKLKILRHYGGPIPRCTRCKVVDVRFLVLDHIDGGGDKERAKTQCNGGDMYDWQIKNNYPSNLQVLCYSCNLRKERKPVKPTEKRYASVVFIRSWNAKLKLKCLRHYSGHIPQCRKCKVKDTRFLVLDHINGGGRKARQMSGMAGSAHYGWLVRNNYPTDLQVLCYHCNLIKERNRRSVN